MADRTESPLASGRRVTDRRGTAVRRPSFPGEPMPVPTADLVCLQCGTVATRVAATMCRRCGLRFGDAPPAFAKLADCPVCYRTTDGDGRLPSMAHRGFRVDIAAHAEEHERFPGGDDTWLETLR